MSDQAHLFKDREKRSEISSEVFDLLQDIKIKPSDMRVIVDPDMDENEFIMSDGTPEGTRKFVMEE